ncbi:MAG: helix-turn-helix domain-containing protein [Terracidiphilus sp.]
MKPYREHLAPPLDASWRLYDRRIEQIPFEWHYHPEYELTLTLNCQGRRFVADDISSYDHGDLVLIGPGIPHTWCSTRCTTAKGNPRAVILWFTEAFVQSMIVPHVELHQVFRLLQKSHRGVSFSKKPRGEAQRLIRAMLGQSPGTRLATFLNLLILLATDRQAKQLGSVAIGEATPAADTEDRVGRIVRHLNVHYRTEKSVAELKKLAAVSRSSLHRLFKLHTGTTIRWYVSRLRVGNACALLINSNKPIEVIADEVGYRNLANFNRQFKFLKGTTPREFRAAFHRQ